MENFVKITNKSKISFNNLTTNIINLALNVQNVFPIYVTAPNCCSLKIGIITLLNPRPILAALK